MEKHATNGVILKANCYRLTWKKLNKDNFIDDLILQFAKCIVKPLYDHKNTSKNQTFI